MSCPAAVVHQSLNSCWWWQMRVDYSASHLQDKTKMSIVHFISTSVAVPLAERAYLLLPRLAVGLLQQRRHGRFPQRVACRCLAHFCSGPSSISVHALFEPWCQPQDGDHNTHMPLLRTPADRSARGWRLASLVSIVHSMPQKQFGLAMQSKCDRCNVLDPTHNPGIPESVLNLFILYCYIRAGQPMLCTGGLWCGTGCLRS